jgi:hypothetical protein
VKATIAIKLGLNLNGFGVVILKGVYLRLELRKSVEIKYFE